MYFLLAFLYFEHFQKECQLKKQIINNDKHGEKFYMRWFT